MLIALLLFASACVAKPFGIDGKGNIDQAAITAGYMESEWDQVVESLEGYLRRKGDNQVTAEERIFAYKFLGVIYAADSLTRPKAESYFTRMLRLSPDIDIVDLFPSLRVIEIFKAAKSDYDKFVRYSAQHDNIGRKTGTVDSAKSPLPAAGPGKAEPLARKTREPKRPEIGAQSHSWIWWSLGLAAAAGVGAGAYYMSTQEKSPQTSSTDVFQP